MHFFSSMSEFFNNGGLIGLALNSFLESFLLVPPPDFLLITMDLANPNKALFYALICTIASAIGGGFGYLIGKFGGKPVFHWLIGMFSKDKKKSEEKFSQVEAFYTKYGISAVFFAAFTPLPYKVFTIASGILDMNLLHFMLASFVGRGMRFFIVSIVLMIFGEQIKGHIELVILLCTLIIILFFIVLYLKRHKFSKK